MTAYREYPSAECAQDNRSLFPMPGRAPVTKSIRWPRDCRVVLSRVGWWCDSPFLASRLRTRSSDRNRNRRAASGRCRSKPPSYPRHPDDRSVGGTQSIKHKKKGGHKSREADDDTMAPAIGDHMHDQTPSYAAEFMSQYSMVHPVTTLYFYKYPALHLTTLHGGVCKK